MLCNNVNYVFYVAFCEHQLGILIEAVSIVLVIRCIYLFDEIGTCFG